MTIATIRERLHDYISTADDKKIEAIYTLLEDQIGPPVEWTNEEEFLAEMDERVRRYEAGIDKAYTLEEIEAYVQELKERRTSE